MQLLSSAEMRETDRRLIEDLGVPGPVLMENAGLRCVELLEHKLGSLRGRTAVVCVGKGNNGGDGFVVARHLHLAGAAVRLVLTAPPEGLSGDAALNYSLASALIPEPLLYTGPRCRQRLTRAFAEAAVVVDALLGTGLTGPAREPVASVIRALNRAAGPVLAVDLPSGVNADTGEVAGEAVRATWTVTFARPKVGLLLHPAAERCGELFVGCFGMSVPADAGAGTRASVVTAGEVAALLPPPRRPDTHKGTYGRIAVLGGSEGMSGAVILACRAALRLGTGLVTAVVPDILNPSLEAALLEATSRPVKSEAGAFAPDAAPALIDAVTGADAVALGPGLSRLPAALAVTREVVSQLSAPTVIDADGLLAFAGALDLLKESRAELILTPHPGEAAALLKTSIGAVQSDRPAAARQLARKTGAVVVLKGSRSLTATPAGDLWVNVTGTPDMATGGSGDVLTGVVASLLGQGLPPAKAARVGVYLHGLAGELASGAHGVGLVAGDLTKCLIPALRGLAERESTAWLTPRLQRLA